MKVIHVTNYFPGTHGHVGGAEQACFRTALLARERGWSVMAATTSPDRNESPRIDTVRLPIVEDWAPQKLRKYLEAAKWYSVQYDPFALHAFRRLLKQNPADVVHFHNCQFLTLSLLSAAKAAGAKTVISIYDYWLFCPTVMLLDVEKRFCTRAHGMWCVDCLPKNFVAFQKALLAFRRSTLDRYMQLCDGFHVLSEHSGSVLAGYGIPESKIHVVPLTLPLEFGNIEEQEESPDPDMILFAGWLNERKGLHRLLEAMPLILKERPSARLTAVGGAVRFGEDYQKSLDEIIAAGGFQDRVTFTGHVQPSRMKGLIQKAAVVVIPEQYENMSPLLMIEAMSMAKPVVVSRVGGIPEFIEHRVSGWLADPLDHKDFAGCVIEVLSDPKTSLEVGRKARETVLAKCADDRVWEKTEAMYMSL